MIGAIEDSGHSADRLALKVDNADLDIFRDTGDLTKAPSVRALAGLGYRRFTWDGKTLHVERSHASEPIHAAGPVPERAPLNPREAGAIQNFAERACAKLKDSGKSFEEASRYWGKTKDPAETAVMQEAFKVLNDPERFKTFLEEILQDAASIQARHPKYGALLAEGHIMRWAVLRALMNKTRALGLDPLAAARQFYRRTTSGGRSFGIQRW